MTVDKPPRPHVAKVRSSANLMQAGRRVISKTLRNSRGESDMHIGGSMNQSAVVLASPRRTGKLCNLDGTEMTTDDYLLVVKGMKAGEAPAIKNFGINNTSIKAW